MYLVCIIVTYRINMYVYIYISTNCIYLCAIILHSRLFCLVIIAIASIIKVLAAIVLGSILFVVVRARTNYVRKRVPFRFLCDSTYVSYVS